MGRYKQRTISDLLKQTSKLHKPRTSAVLEGKARMQGPLNEVEAEVDYKELQVCRDCRNYLDASDTQNCSICSVGYHNVCLQALTNADADTIQCCYKCQTLSVHEKHKLASTEASTNEVVHDKEAQERKDLCRTIEVLDICQSVGPLYTAKEQPAVSEGSDANPDLPEMVSSKPALASNGKFSDTVGKPPLSLITNRIRKKGVRCNKTAENLEHSSQLDPVAAAVSQTCSISVKGSDWDDSQSLAINKDSTQTGNVIDKQTISDLLTNALVSNKSIQIGDHATTHEESKDGLEFKASVIEQGKALQSKVGVTQRSLHGDMLSTSCALTTQSLKMLPRLPDDCAFGPDLDSLDGDTAAANSEIAKEPSKKLDSEKLPIGRDLVSIDDYTAVAKSAIAKDPHRKLNSESNIRKEVLQVKPGMVLNASTLSDEVGVEAQMDTRIHLPNDCPSGSCEGLSKMQGQATTDGEQASEVLLSVQEQMADRTQNVACMALIQMDIIQDAEGHTVCSLSTQRPAGLESQINADSLVGLQNTEGPAHHCAHQVLAPNLSSPVIHSPFLSSPGKLLEVKEKSTLLDVDGQVVPLPDSVHPLATDGGVEADLDKEHPSIVNESGDIKETRLQNVNPFKSATIDAKNTLTSQEEGGTLPLVAASIRASFEDDDQVKVCDICGDPGYEDMLLVCSECNEGAEHVYCVQTLLSQVSEGYWQCEGCRMEPRVRGSGQLEICRVNSVAASLPSLNSNRKQSNTGNAHSRLSDQLVRRIVGPEKRRALKGIPSCQFPAKRHAADNIEDAPGAKKQACQFLAKRRAADTIENAPGAKKQASETSGPSVQAINVPTARHGLSRECSFKIPDTGKMKFICNTTLIGNGTGGQGTGPRSGGTRKLSVPVGTNMGQSGQKGGFANSSNISRDSLGVTKTIEDSQPNSSFTALPSITSPGLKSLGALKSGDALPSFLLPSKFNFTSKGLINNKNSKVIEVGMQGLAKEGSSGGKSPMASTRIPGKINSFKIPKTSTASCLEQKSRTEAHKGPLRSLSSKTICSDAVMVKAVESKCNLPHDSTPFLASELITPLSTSKSSATLPSHGVSHSGIPVIHNTPRTLHNKGSPSRNEAVSAGPALHNKFESENTHQSICHPKLNTSLKPFENFGSEEDKRNAQKTSSVLTMKVAEKASVVTSNEVPMLNGGEKRMAALESSLIKSVQPREEPCSFRSERDIVFQPPQKGSACTVKGAAANIDSGMTTSQHSEHFQSSSTETAAAIKCCEKDRDLDLEFGMQKLQNVKFDRIEVQWQQEEAQNNAGSSPSPLSESTDSGMNPNASRLETVEIGGLGACTGRESSSTLGLCHGEIAHVVLQDACAKPASLSGNLAASLSNCTFHDVIGNKDEHFKEATNANRSSVLTGDSVGGTVLPTAAQSSMSPIKQRTTAFHVPLMTKTATYMSGTPGTHIKLSPNTFGPPVPRYEESQTAYPQSFNVWRGTFEVTAKGDLRNSFHGLQAHLSNRALAKVQEVVKKLQSPLPLQELPRGSEYNTWPYQFQKSPPNTDNIALYFFARDKERYEQSYKPLVDRLIKHDLALKGQIEDAELLIFPSNLLPPPSQCWNNFMFLWAVFRERKPVLSQRVSISTPSICQQADSRIASKPMQQPTISPCVWGEDMQISTIGGKNFHASDMVGNKCERPIFSGTPQMLASTGVPYKHPEVQCTLPAESFCQQALQSSSPALQAVAKEAFKHSVDREEVSLPGKATVLEFSTVDGLSDLETQHSELVSCSKEELSGLDLSSGYEPAAQKQVAVRNLGEEDNIHTEVITVSISKSNNASQLLPTKEHGNVETSRHFPLWRQSPPALIVCPSPRERQEDAWTHRELSRSSSRSPIRYRDRSKQRGISEYEYERKWGKERMSSGGGFYKDKAIERERGRDRERERDWERRRRHREKEWEWGRERGEERDRERERRGRDRGRESEKLREREQGRERDVERKRERERSLGRDRGRHSDHDRVDLEHDKESRRWRHLHSGSLSRSSPGPHHDRSRPWSPTLRSDHTYDRYRWYYHSRSYSRSPDSNNQTGHLQEERAESRDWSQNSCVHKKSPAISVGDLEGKDESVMENKVTSDGVVEEPCKFSRQGSSGSLCREHTTKPSEWLTPIADLNVAPVEISGNKDDVPIVPDAMQPVIDHDSTGHYHNFLAAGSLGSSYLGLGKSTSHQDIGCTEHGDPASIVGKLLFNEHHSINPLSIHGEQDYNSFRQVSNSPDPLLCHLSLPSEISSSCLPFFPVARECCDDENTVFNAPDLNLALGGKWISSPKKELCPFFMKLLDTPEESPSARSSSPNVTSNTLEQVALSLSLAISEHTQHPEVDARKGVHDEFVNTSLRLFG